MSADLPRHYFRIRENGAVVFRVGAENRQRRMELEEIAFVNLKSGNIRPHGESVLGEDDQAAIAAWLAARQEVVARRELDDVQRTIDQLNLTAHWVQTRADDAALEAISDKLLLAMHDLRSVLVRRNAERLRDPQS